MNRLRGKTYSYLKEKKDEDIKGIKNCAIKRKLKNFKIIKTVQEKKQFNVDNLKEFAKNKLILKTQQRFKSERHSVFTEEINKLVLSSNGDKRMQSTNSTETYVYGKKQRHNVMI